MKKLSIVAVLVLNAGLTHADDTPAPNTLTPQESKHGWKLLFDGKTLSGWRLYNKKGTGNWAVQDGTIVSGNDDLMTTAKYGDFELSVDWKFEKGDGNSGIIYRVAETKGPSWETGPEMQVLGSRPNTKLAKYDAGAFYDLFAPSKNTLKPMTDWNTFKIVAVGKHFEHWVNGVKVVDTTMGTDAWNKALANSKFKNNKEFASHASGYICLQEHGSKVHFRNIKIRVVNYDSPGAAAPPLPSGGTAPLADGDFRVGPTYTKAPELTIKDGVPRGMLHEFTMASQDSKIYPGLKGPYKRKMAVYVPSQYVAGTPAPFIVIQDDMTKGILPKILDNMIADHRLPAMVAIFISSGGGDGKGSERGLEYDAVSDRYVTFIETEVLPRIEKDYKVIFTKDPDGRAAMGGSSGAAAAFTMAWFRPDLYHRVLSYSGTYVDQQSPHNPESPHGAWEYHEHLIPKNAAKPLRVWLQVGDRDNGYKRDEASLHNWVMANDRMAAALKAKGYHYRYVFSVNAGHVDGKVVNQTLPEALLWLWQGYPIR